MCKNEKGIIFVKCEKNEKRVPDKMKLRYQNQMRVPTTSDEKKCEVFICFESVNNVVVVVGKLGSFLGM